MARRRSNNDAGAAAGIFLVLLVIAFVIKFWVWILGALLLWWLIKFGVPAGQRAVREMQAETQAEHERIDRRNAELVARCDQQHEALMNDDITLGMYGEFPPPDGLK
jgi:F0F1-type ATP synthase membrane subunit b/b'